MFLLEGEVASAIPDFSILINQFSIITPTFILTVMGISFILTFGIFLVYHTTKAILGIIHYILYGSSYKEKTVDELKENAFYYNGKYYL